jgi:cation diffusion facilitator family transporter
MTSGASVASSVDDALRAEAASARRRAGWVSLAAGAAICAGKFAAAGLTGSTALFSDALESIVNVAAAGMLVAALVVAARPADHDHPYGHGKVEFFSAGVEGALIAMAALLIVWQAASSLMRGPRLAQLDVGLALSAGLAAANAALGAFLVKSGRRHGSDALVADGRHVLSDVLTTAGVIAGLGAVWITGLAMLDPLIAIAVALVILRTGWTLVRGSIGGLMDEADPALLAPICAALEREREPAWIDVHELRSFRSGSVQHTDLHLAVPRYFDADQLHAISDRLRAVVLGATGRAGDVIVHFDPCRPRQCPGCAMSDCPVRSAPFRERPPVSLERAQRPGDAVGPIGALE